MSFFSDASLVYVPSGVKDAKTYSIKPTDGSGDLTFSRGSDIEATRVNANGYIEKAQVNLLLQSNSFDTTWVTYDTSVTGGQSGYDGTSDAWLLAITGATGFQTIRQTVSGTGVQTFSIYAKAGTLNWIRFTFAGGAAPTNYYNIADGTLGSIGGGEASIVSVGGGWYRCSASFDGTFTELRIYPATDNNNPNQSSGNIYLQDAQLNYGLVAQTYQETTTAAVVSGITNDMPRLNYDPANPTCPSLILEPSRTNLVTFSEYYDASDWAKSGSPSITTNSATSPEGLQNASTLTSTASSDRIQLTRSAITGSVTYSAYVKSNGAYTKFRLRDSGSGNDARLDVNADGTITYDTGTNTSYKIEELLNGWYRLSFTFTAAVGTSLIQLFPDYTSGGGSLYVYGLQCEAGNFVSSYIPSYGSSATRTADACSKTGISSILNDSAGTLFLDIQGISDGGDSRRLTISDGTTGNRVSIELDETAGRINAFYSALGLLNGTLVVDGITQTERHKIAFNYSSTVSKIYIDGVLKSQDDTILAVPTGLSLLEFANGAGSLPMEGLINQVLYFPTALSDSELATLTSL